MNTAIIIPCHNEALYIADVVKKAKKYGTVIVADDGSTDATAIEARHSGAEVYCLPKNMGAGAASRVGFAASKNFDIIVTLDGDAQHDPDDMPRLLNAIKDGYDVVIGSRFLSSKQIKMPIYRRFGNWLITLSFNFGHKPIKDSQSGFRAFTRKALDKLDYKENGFGFATEMIIKARKQGLRICEVPISCSYHNLAQDSHMNPFSHGFGVIVKTVEWRIREKN
jgi:glycosyltransferase involved in cell wall biosynthesis